jgi:dynein heavy chain, axonemal
MIHWTRQIKEVLSAQDALQTSENAGPLEEIEFWKNRCDDLSGISTQLDKAGVKKITAILQVAKSSYVAPFLKLSGQIKVSASCLRIFLVSSMVDNVLR